MGHTLEKSKISGDANYGIKKLLLHWAKKEIKSRMSFKVKKSTSPGEVKDEIPQTQVINGAVSETANEEDDERKSVQVLAVSLKKQILLRDQCCQFKIHPDAKVCGSRHFLEVDHIQPKWAGGVDHPENLRAICRQHNQWRYEVARLYFALRSGLS